LSYPILAGSNEMAKTNLTSPNPVAGVVPLSDNERLVSGTCDSKKKEITLRLETGEQLITTCLDGAWETHLPEEIPGIVDLIIDGNKLVLVSPVVKGLTIEVADDEAMLPPGITHLKSTLNDLVSDEIGIILISLDGAILLKHELVEVRENALIEIDTSHLFNDKYALLLRKKTGGKQVYSNPLAFEVIGNKPQLKTVLDRVKNYYHEECRGLEARAATQKIIEYLHSEDMVVSIESDNGNISWTTRDGRLWIFHMGPYAD
jgi:hypothetical protein